MDPAALLDGHRLLDHPFYRRWEAGELTAQELASYAAQYRYFEAQLPSFLEALGATLPAGEARDLVQANLADEVDGPVSHLELFDRFADAVGAPDEAVSEQMAALVRVYGDAAARSDADFALGVLAGYEIQAAEVAASKGDGLSRHYGVQQDATAFWDVHAEIEHDHAAWTLQAAAPFSDCFIAGAKASSTAWWRFLDERQSLCEQGALAS